MKLFFLPLFVFPVFLNAAPKEMDGYFIYGQSNANGRSYNNEFTNEVLQQSYDTNLFFAYRERTWQKGKTAVEIPLGPILPDQLNRVGVEVTLGRYLSAHSPRPVLLVKFCSGGTSIKNFLPNADNLFLPMIEYLKGKEREMAKKGFHVNWKGAFVVTGESDCGEANAAKFRERFLTVQSALEKELGISSLPIAYGLLRGNWIDTPSSKYSRLNKWADLINKDMSALAKSDGSVRVTSSTADLKTRVDNGDSKTDGIHYCSNSYALLGRRLYSTAFPDRSAVIDRNGNGLSDVWELKYKSNERAGTEAIQERKKSAIGTDSDEDGITDWAEQQLAGFDFKSSDSFGIGEPFSDLPILLSMIDGVKSRIGMTMLDWKPETSDRSTGRLGIFSAQWLGPQHESTTSGGQIVTTNGKGNHPVSHTVSFDPAIAKLELSVSGIGKSGKVEFDIPFSVSENPDNAELNGNVIQGNGVGNSRVNIEFSQPVKTLKIITPGNDAVFFSFSAEVENPGVPLKWRE